MKTKNIFWENLRNAKKNIHEDNLIRVIQKTQEQGYEIIKPIQIHKCLNNAGCILAYNKFDKIGAIYRTISKKWALAIEISQENISYKIENGQIKNKTSLDYSHIYEDIILEKHGRGYEIHYPADYLLLTTANITPDDFNEKKEQDQNLIKLLSLAEKENYQPAHIVLVENSQDNACIVLEKKEQPRSKIQQFIRQNKPKKFYKGIRKIEEKWELSNLKLKYL